MTHPASAEKIKLLHDLGAPANQLEGLSEDQADVLIARYKNQKPFQVEQYEPIAAAPKKSWGFIVKFILFLVVAGGGYFGYQQWIAMQEEDSQPAIEAPTPVIDAVPEPEQKVVYKPENLAEGMVLDEIIECLGVEGQKKGAVTTPEGKVQERYQWSMTDGRKVKGLLVDGQLQSWEISGN